MNNRPTPNPLPQNVDPASMVHQQSSLNIDSRSEPHTQLSCQLSKLKGLQSGLAQQYASEFNPPPSALPVTSNSPSTLRTRTSAPAPDPQALNEDSINPDSSSANKAKDRFSLKQDQAKILAVKLNELRQVMHEITYSVREFPSNVQLTEGDLVPEPTNPSKQPPPFTVPRPSVSFNRGSNPLELPSINTHFRQTSNMPGGISSNPQMTPSNAPTSMSRDPLSLGNSPLT